MRHHVMAIGQQRNLTGRQLAFSMGMATAVLILRSKDVLAPVISLQLAAEIMFSTAKMAPLERTFG